jgi:hypothetical protein
VRARTRLLLPPKGSKDNRSQREYLEEFERRTGKRSKRLDEPVVPREISHIWRAFWALYQGEPLSFLELRAWSELTGASLTPWEAETLRMMSLVAVREARDG